MVAYVDGKPAGYLVGYDEFGDGSFYSLMAGVDPKFRGQGVLKAMMKYQDAWARKKGYNKIRIKTRNNRREMLAYLVKYGFYAIEVQPKPKIEDYRILFEKNL
jgi:GNAT superfamily N-acetyltransferase